VGLCVAADKEASAPAGNTIEQPAPADAPRAENLIQPVIALLLPVASPDFARPAEAVRQGFMAALKASGDKLPVGVFPTDASNQNILSQYEKALKAGVRVVVGPMTRSGVSALAASQLVSVPTLGLNLAEGTVALPAQFYTFGLAVEAEAQLVARSAFASNYKSAVLVSAKSPLAQRGRDAFAATWLQLGGTIKSRYDFTPQTDMLALKETLSTAVADMIFLAADFEQARTVRPFLNNGIDVFATSQVYSGRPDPLANVDLNGIRFVEMPWLVQPDHAAVMIYPRPEGISPDLERFYALGIDAYRIAAELLNSPRTFNLDGVTGRLTLSGNQVALEPVQAVFRNGAGTLLDDAAAGETAR
jgi:outer membrane PBP1 activator LpoA protein